jgi:hypothetical protein
MGTGLRRCGKIFEQLDCGQRVDMVASRSESRADTNGGKAIVDIVAPADCSTFRLSTQLHSS